MEVDPVNKCITDAFCKCKQGHCGTCSHTLAVVYLLEQWKIAGYKDMPALLSSTSLPQQWDKPRGSKIRAEPVAQMIFARPGTTNRKRKPVMVNHYDNRKIQLTNEDITGLKSLTSSPISYLTEETTESTLYIDTFSGPQPVGCALSYHANLLQPAYKPRKEMGCGEINFSTDSQLNSDTKTYLDDMSAHWANVALSPEECANIEKQTRDQSCCDEWYRHRKVRITASKFGAIMKRKKQINEAFLRNNFNQTPFVSKATTHGQVNERTAKIMYVKKTGSHLHDVGLVINPNFPFLGASPDAIVCSNGEMGLVEVKCPYSARNFMINEAVDLNLKDFCLIRDGENIRLNDEHSYFYQVQGQLLVTGFHFCDFVLYTEADDIFVERIKPHRETMEKLLRKMTDFYINDFKQYVSVNQNE